MVFVFVLRDEDYAGKDDTVVGIGVGVGVGVGSCIGIIRRAVRTAAEVGGEEEGGEEDEEAESDGDGVAEAKVGEVVWTSWGRVGHWRGGKEGEEGI